jgi:toxin ParE1/3/4
MAKVILRQEAINDLNEIWLYTFEKWSEKQADKYYSLLEYTCLEIGNNAELGKEYNGVETSLFGLKTGKHIIFYRIITKQEIEIIRILHERMDLKNSFD